MRNLEFFNFDNEVWVRFADGTKKRLLEGDSIIKDMLDYISENYPDAYKALEERYSRISPNIPYYRFRIVSRFIRCNFGEANTQSQDVDECGNFRFERVPCPIRGECPLEGIVCSPKFCSKISPAETRVLELLYRHYSVEEIADRLFIAIDTVKNHRRNAFCRIGVHSTAEFISYANTHNLFDIK